MREKNKKKINDHGLVIMRRLYF